jgi:hypothetical protein
MTWPEFIDQHFWALWWLSLIAMGATVEAIFVWRKR